MARFQSHVALFMTYLGGGGAERVMFNLANGLIEQQVRVDFVVGSAWGSHVKKVPDQVKLVDLKATGVRQTTFALTNYLKQEKPNSLLSAQHFANEMAIWAKRLARVSTTVVVSEHNTLSRAIQHTTRLRSYLIPRFIRYFYPWADEIVAVSKGVAHDLAKNTGLPADRIQTIYNSVVTPEVLEKARMSVDHPWFNPGEPPVILGVGKLEAQKDFPNLIQAFAQVREQQAARLMILGWGPDQSRLENLAKQLGVADDVALPGYVDNPYPYMANAKVFVLSSAWEGLPTVLIEAMAVGTPVVSTDCPSGPGEILDQGQYGLLCPVGDSQALAQAILDVLNGDSTKPIDPSWLEQFTIAAATQKYMRALGVGSPSDAN
ncbi:MAG: glycosyltransferase [Microcoleaceae cyanobacterium]